METAPGIAQCSKTVLGTQRRLIAIDPNEGGKIRVVSESAPGSLGAPQPLATFNTKTAKHWAQFIQNNEGPSVPSPSKLAFVVNAGFCYCENDTGPTTLALPEKKAGYIQTYGHAFGNARNTDPPDAAWDWEFKKSVKFGDPNETPQKFGSYPLWRGWMYEQPGHYDQNNIYAAFGVDEPYNDTFTAFDGTVGFHNDDAPADANAIVPRTYFISVESNFAEGEEMAYILQSDGDTLEGLNNFMYEELGDYMQYWAEVTQLDGGKSTQSYSVAEDDFWTGYKWPLSYRSVPEVLAIYHG